MTDKKTIWEKHVEKQKLREEINLKKKSNSEYEQILREIRDLKIKKLREERKWKFDEIAKQYGITRQRAHQLYKRAVKTAEKELKKHGE